MKAALMGTESQELVEARSTDPSPQLAWFESLSHSGNCCCWYPWALGWFIRLLLWVHNSHEGSKVIKSWQAEPSLLQRANFNSWKWNGEMKRTTWSNHIILQLALVPDYSIECISAFKVPYWKLQVSILETTVRFHTGNYKLLMGWSQVFAS